MRKSRKSGGKRKRMVFQRTLYSPNEHEEARNQTWPIADKSSFPMSTTCTEKIRTYGAFFETVVPEAGFKSMLLVTNALWKKTLPILNVVEFPILRSLYYEFWWMERSKKDLGGFLGQISKKLTACCAGCQFFRNLPYPLWLMINFGGYCS